MNDFSNPYLDKNASNTLPHLVFSSIIAGVVCGLGATTAFDTLSLSTSKHAFTFPKARDVLSNSIMTIAISTAIFGYSGYRNMIADARVRESHAEKAGR